MISWNQLTRNFQQLFLGLHDSIHWIIKLKIWRNRNQKFFRALKLRLQSKNFACFTILNMHEVIYWKLKHFLAISFNNWELIKPYHLTSLELPQSKLKNVLSEKPQFSWVLGPWLKDPYYGPRLRIIYAWIDVIIVIIIAQVFQNNLNMTF